MRSISLLLASVTLVLAACASEHRIVLDGGPAPTDDLQVQMNVERDLGRTPPVIGNHVDLLLDGTEALPAMFKDLSRAHDSINLEYFTFDDVRAGGQTLGGVLIDRLNHGVAVAIIYDAYGSPATPAAFLERLAQAGAAITIFNPNPFARGRLDSPNNRDHRKVMVIDGRIAFVGGINLDHVYENPASSGDGGGDAAHAFWRDTAIRITGPAVAGLQRGFFDTWTKQKGRSLPSREWFPALSAQGNGTVRILASEPADDKPLYYLWLLNAVHAARRSISLTTGYFVPTHQEREELVKAARRGVRVRLVVPAHGDSDDAIAAGRAAYDDLLEAGVKIYEVQTAVLHSKFAVIDGVWMTIGSSNFDRRSAVFNNEIDAIVLGPDASGGEAVIEQNIAMSKEIDLRTWRDRPFGERWHEWRARLWEFQL